jgi:phosphoglucosamine mutase
MRDNNIDVVITPVGDRSILVALEEFDFVLGGEQSGHVIHRAHATTGDGLLAALQLVEYITRARVTLDQAASIMQSYPQILVNIRTLNRVHDPVHDIAEQIAQAEAELGDDGRILVRSSGTESLVRVMVEAADQVSAESIAMRLAQSLVDIHGGSIEGTH